MDAIFSVILYNKEYINLFTLQAAVQVSVEV
jgi:hypothetical protein